MLLRARWPMAERSASGSPSAAGSKLHAMRAVLPSGRAQALLQLVSDKAAFEAEAITTLMAAVSTEPE